MLITLLPFGMVCVVLLRSACQVFDQFDLDGNGKISNKELKAALGSGHVSELEGDVSAIDVMRCAVLCSLC